MIYFKEILPNPAGKDTEGEWIKLINTGVEATNLHGWKITDTSGKTYILGTTIESGKEIVLEYSVTKIALNNNGDRLELVGVGGETVDTISYSSASDDEIIIAERFIEEIRDETAPRIENIGINSENKTISGGESSAILVALVFSVVAGALVGWFLKNNKEK